MEVVTKEDIYRAFKINDCSEFKTGSICSKDILDAFTGVPDIEMNETEHIIHNLGDGNDDAMIDLMKFVEACQEKSSESPEGGNMIVKLVNYKRMETERIIYKNEPAIDPSTVLQDANKLQSLDATIEKSVTHPLTDKRMLNHHSLKADKNTVDDPSLKVIDIKVEEKEGQGDDLGHHHGKGEVPSMNK